MSIEEIGCCGAYCGTCKEKAAGRCKGCKSGYADGARDITKAKCEIKRCCISRNLNSCAVCDQYETCNNIQYFHAKNGYKYKKYKEAIDFIRANGYTEFLNIADKWKLPYGKYK